MASSKISELTAASSIVLTDLIPFVSDPSGSPATKKITANSFANSLFSNVQISVIPSANVTTNLGSTSKYWNTNYVKTLTFSDSTSQNTAFQKVSVPASSSSNGTLNQIAWDSNSIYICVSTNTWKKVNLSSF